MDKTPHPEGPTMTDKTEAMDLAKTLDELSKAATPSLVVGPSEKALAQMLRKGAEHMRPRASNWAENDYEADATFIATLVAFWNAYRTGNLVVAPDDAVELTLEDRRAEIQRRRAEVATNCEHNWRISDYVGAGDSLRSRMRCTKCAETQQYVAALKGVDHAG